MEDLRTYTTGKAPKTSAHTLRKGESLSDVATRYGLSVDELLSANPQLNPYYYRAGDALNVPGLSNVACDTDCCTGRLYCVVAGDSLESIAAAFGITAAALLEANPVLSQTGLLAGLILCIPAIPEEPAPEPCPEGAVQVLIQEGQTVIDVLVAYNVSFNALSSMNPGADLLNLSAGDVLCVPPSGSQGTCLDCSATYTIAAGENLLSIAQSTGTDPADLMIMNPTFLPGDFIPGRTICLP